MRTNHRLAAALLLATTAACGDGNADQPVTTTQAPTDTGAARTAYIAGVVADPPGDDLAPDGGEHVVINNDATIRIDMGGWWIEVDGDILPLGVGRQIDVGAVVRVHTGAGQSTDQDVYAGLDHEVLDDGGVLILRDSAGIEVSRFAYGP